MLVRWLVAGACVLAAGPGFAEGVRRPVVVELFTSQGCSSCPPADAIVAELARGRPDLLPLTFHVTYWNGLGWTDPFSLAAATERQRRYVALGVSPDVYTPAMVIDGARDAVGSVRRDVEAGLSAAAAGLRTGTTVAAVRGGDGRVTIDLGAGGGGAEPGAVLLVGFDRAHATPVGRGENGGRTLVEANIVRSIAGVGRWAGAAQRLQAAWPGGEEAAVIVQADDGRIIGAGRVAAGGG